MMRKSLELQFCKKDVLLKEMAKEDPKNEITLILAAACHAGEINQVEIHTWKMGLRFMMES